MGASTRTRNGEDDNLQWEFDGDIGNLLLLDRPLEEIEILFLAEGGGGFSLYRPDGGPLSEGVTLVTLAKTGETSGEVRGLTMDGINSRWGAADRSEADPACWTGSDFEVCAYGL